MAEIRALGSKNGDREGCVVCHGGTPSAELKVDAHQGAPPGLSALGGPQQFYVNPGNLLVAKYTCGQCHTGYSERLTKSLISTEVESIQRDLCLNALQVYKSQDRSTIRQFGKHAISDTDGSEPAAGSPAYKAYMKNLAANPALFRNELHAIPSFEKTVDIQQWEQQCSSCHSEQPAHTVSLNEDGTGCSSCHVPYQQNAGYQGKDVTIDKSQPGKLLLHRLQGTASGRGKDNLLSNTAILENCFSCHHDVRSQELNPIGIVMTHYGSFHEDEMGGALLCQDCHTTIDMHGDGNIPLNSHAQVEIKCEDCHGTVEKAPWELPIGFGEKFAGTLPEKPRGLANDAANKNIPLDVPVDGYLLTARGNPFGNIIKSGNQVILYSATGKTIPVPVLKFIHQDNTWKSSLSRSTKAEVPAHLENMNCTSCHGDRAPLCIGCHGAAQEMKWGIAQ